MKKQDLKFYLKSIVIQVLMFNLNADNKISAHLYIGKNFIKLTIWKEVTEDDSASIWFEDLNSKSIGLFLSILNKYKK